MQENITRFKLDNLGIAVMLEGKSMPHPPVIFVSVITVTFIGLGELPKSWFKVAKHILDQVTCCCCSLLAEEVESGHVKISEERLNSLPEDDIQDEIISIIHHSNEVGVVDKEGTSGYIPTDEDGTNSMPTSMFKNLGPIEGKDNAGGSVHINQ